MAASLPALSSAPNAPASALLGEVATLAFDAAPDPMALLAADGEVLAANAAFHHTFRFQVSARRPAWGRVVPPDFGAAGTRIFDAASPDGRIFEWREQRDTDGRRVAIARDVTVRSQAAAAADRAKTALFATLTHELRTPLNGILGMAGLLARTPLEASQAEFVTALRRSGEHLLDLITEILDFSRLEAGRIVLDDAPFAPDAVIQEVVELLSPKAFDKGLELVTRTAPQTPKMVRGDAGRLRQVLFNLVGNAVKFTDRGGVAVTLDPCGPGRLLICVRDTGPGIPEDKQAHIFEEFAQANVAHARMHGGTGLGLAIVRKLCATMGGEVRVASRAGHGATFSVEVPMVALEGADVACPLTGIKAHLLTSNPVIAVELRTLLEALGAGVTVSASPPRVVEADVLLVDHPPGGDPSPRLPQTAPIIVLSPQEQRDVLSAYEAKGVRHYLLKPLRKASLVEQIQAVVARRPAAPFEVQDERARDVTDALAGLRVLVADDNPINALLARTVLTRAGCTVQVAQDGEEAVNAALKASPPFDLVLLDLRMPGVDGFAAARLIRAAPGPIGRTPLIALTADDSDEDRKTAIAAGMDAFLTKPIQLARLVHAAARFTPAPNGATLTV